MSVFFNLLRCRGNLQFSNGEPPSVVGKPMNSCTSLLEKLKIGRQYSDNGAYYNSKSPALLLLRRKQRVPISDIEKISTMSRHEKMCPAFPAFETISAFSRVLVEMAKKTLAETAAKGARKRPRSLKRSERGREHSGENLLLRACQAAASKAPDFHHVTSMALQ